MQLLLWLFQIKGIAIIDAIIVCYLVDVIVVGNLLGNKLPDKIAVFRLYGDTYLIQVTNLSVVSSGYCNL